jgi:predicted DNA-binding transcriptional regulator AlpA
MSRTNRTMLDGDDRQAAIYPGTVTVPETARLLGVSKSAAYRAIAARLAGDVGAWPTKVVRIGRTLRIPAAELSAVLTDVTPRP